MTFNQNANISGNRVRKGGGAKAGGIAAGGLGGIGVIVFLLISMFGGGNVDLSELGLTSAGQAQYEPSDGTATLDECLTGADANEKVECRTDRMRGRNVGSRPLLLPC